MTEFTGFTHRHSDAECIAYCRSRFEGIQAQYDGKFVVRSDEDDLQLRMKIDSLPARISVNYHTGDLEMDLKSKNRIGTLLAYWDEDFPTDVIGERTPVDADDDWDDESISLRHFIGKGVALEGTKQDLDTMVPLANQLPPEVLSDIIDSTSTLRLMRTDADYSGINLLSYDNLYERTDEGVVGMFAFLLRLGEAFSRGDKEVAPPPGLSVLSSPLLHAINCHFCNTKFPPTQSMRCPNCGAPIRSEDSE